MEGLNTPIFIWAADSMEDCFNEHHEVIFHEIYNFFTEVAETYGLFNYLE